MNVSCKQTRAGNCEWFPKVPVRFIFSISALFPNYLAVHLVEYLDWRLSPGSSVASLCVCVCVPVPVGKASLEIWQWASEYVVRHIHTVALMTCPCTCSNAWWVTLKYGRLEGLWSLRIQSGMPPAMYAGCTVLKYSKDWRSCSTSPAKLACSPCAFPLVLQFPLSVQRHADQVSCKLPIDINVPVCVYVLAFGHTCASQVERNKGRIPFRYRLLFSCSLRFWLRPYIFITVKLATITS